MEVLWQGCIAGRITTAMSVKRATSKVVEED